MEEEHPIHVPSPLGAPDDGYDNCPDGTYN